MPKLPAVSGREVVSPLERLGFEQTRQRGSHVIMRRGAKGCSVPMHREIKQGTLAEIIRQTDVSAEELIAALK